MLLLNYMDNSFPDQLRQTYLDALFWNGQLDGQNTQRAWTHCFQLWWLCIWQFNTSTGSLTVFKSSFWGKVAAKKLFDGWVQEPDGTIVTGPPCQEQQGKGHLNMVVCNLKDNSTSLHFFCGKPKDGWDGNKHNWDHSVISSILSTVPMLTEIVSIGSILWLKQSRLWNPIAFWLCITKPLKPTFPCNCNKSMISWGCLLCPRQSLVPLPMRVQRSAVKKRLIERA